MNQKYFRFDYPAQCVDVESYSRFIKTPDVSASAFKGRVLIVANQLELTEKFNTLFNVVSLLGAVASSIDLVCVNATESELSLWQRKFKKQGADVGVCCIEKKIAVLQSPISDVLEDSYQFDAWLEASGRHYDIVFAYDCLALLFYRLQKSQLGLIDRDVKYIAFSSSTAWFNTVKSGSPVFNPTLLNVFYAEQMVLSQVDAFVSNSLQLLIWLSEQSGEPNEHFYALNMPIDHAEVAVESSLSVNGGANGGVKEIVFVFSNQDCREANLCMEALNRMDLSAWGVTVVLPEKPRRALKAVFKKSSIDFTVNVICIASDDVKWIDYINVGAMIFVVSSEFLSPSLLTYLRESDATFFENDATRQNKDNKACIDVFHHNVTSIESLLVKASALSGQKKSDANISLGRFDVAFLNAIVDERRSTLEVPFQENPTVSVCISHCDRGDLLLRAIESIMSQTYPCQEIIVVDEHSLAVLSELEARDSSPTVNVIRQKKSYIGASRNKGLAAVTSDYVMFMDDDNEAKPDELDMFVKAVSGSGADILTCLSEVFSGERPQESLIDLQHALFVGSNRASALFTNPYGDSNMFANVKKIRELGGFSEYYRVGRDDHEFFVRATNAGLIVKLLPVPLYYYRLNQNRIRNSHINQYAGAARVAQTFSQGMDMQSAQMLRYAQSLSFAVGPFGVNSRLILLKLQLLEYARIYMAKFPFLYRIFKKIRSIF